MSSATNAVPLRFMLVARLRPVHVSRKQPSTPPSVGNITVAQNLGDRELTVVLRRVTSVPGPLHVDVITRTGTSSGRLALEITPTGTSAGSSALPPRGRRPLRRTSTWDRHRGRTAPRSPGPPASSWCSSPPPPSAPAGRCHGRSAAPVRVFGGTFTAPLGYLISGIGTASFIGNASFLLYSLLDLAGTRSTASTRC
jgi:hypothetical protein